MNMTRENKLALVVGFGLVLFVGILISDHFSTARNQESADIRTGRLVDPLAQSRHDNVTLLELPGARRADDGNRRTAPPLAMNTGQFTNGEPDSRGDSSQRSSESLPPRNDIPRIVMGGNNSDDRIDVRRPGEAVEFVFHHVQAGESLIAITRRYYGDDSLVKELARFNEIDNPNTIRVGHRLRIPNVAALRGSSPATITPAATQQQQSAPSIVYTTYTIARGDTLSEISQQLLGTARRWREIYEMNKDVIRDPDNLIAGTELKIPRPGR